MLFSGQYFHLHPHTLNGCPISISAGGDDSEAVAKEGNRVAIIKEQLAGDGVRTHDVQLGKLAFYH